MSSIADSLSRPSRWGLFWISFVMLFLELVLIRWCGTEASVFAYLQNMILVVCFLGIGLGCLISGRTPQPGRGLAALSVLVLLLSWDPGRRALSQLSLWLTASGELVAWNEKVGATNAESLAHLVLGLVFAFVLLMLLVEVFIPIGQIFGALVERDRNALAAYSVNVLGSLAGILAFVACGVLLKGPVTWMLLLSLASLLFLGCTGTLSRKTALLSFLPALISLPALDQHPAIEVLWSPYQKISLLPLSKTDHAYRYNVLVNNYPFLGVAEALNEVRWNDPRILYDLPPLLKPGAKKMLIAGAGSGNDVSGALRHNIPSITAVEIDPAIISIGRRYHPQHPYQHSAVTIVRDDARSFFFRTKQKYDLILIAMLDSHTAGVMANTRLDHFVYTKESLERAASLLEPGGVMVLSFFAKRPFIASRMDNVLTEIFGSRPLSFRFPLGTLKAGGTMFVAGNVEGARSAIEENENLRGLIAKWQREMPLVLESEVKATTDDWPYLYLESPRIPLLFVLMAALAAALLLYIKKRHRIIFAGAGWSKSAWTFFFMGAAFLLLEVHNVAKASMVFGATWNVNSIIISGILLMVLAGNAVVMRWPRLPLMPAFVCIIGACLLLYCFDVARLAELETASKAAAMIFLPALPMFFSSIAFAQLFNATENRSTALGANILGALTGGLLQSATFLTGFRTITLLIASLYLCAMVLALRRSRA